ncbi:MAG: RICIN domain-containing protein [Bacteroidaceae bacterium]|nr:RICIN domain-containing protein [Bacteroidaceae bacterium]
MKNILAVILLALGSSAQAQVLSTASYMTPPVQHYDVEIPFRLQDEGVATPIEWGLDLAWLQADNVRTGVAYAGKELIDIMRVSFRPTDSVEEGVLSADQKAKVKERADIVKRYCKNGVTLNLNDDHESVDAWYNKTALSSAEIGRRWAKVIDLHIDEYAKNGLTNFVSISPYNEPDLGWSQGRDASRKADMKATIQSLRNDFDGKYDAVRMCGGNTLNDDKAYEWWNYMKEVLDEGNTHQLAGSFDNYASFFEKVRDYGHHATADELHNTMEAMVGVEYGMQTGIWWGTCEHTRSQFMKATYHDNPGKRLGYAEHRDNWTAASVYRHADGSVQGFGGTSERQAVETSFHFTSLDRPVWYNGRYGRDHVMLLPGGTGYQTGQVNAETLVDIQSGEDIMPYIPSGEYYIVNVNSNLMMGFSTNPGTGWTSIKQVAYSSKLKYRQWRLEPAPQSGDLTYWNLYLNSADNLLADILNWNADAGADVGTYPGGNGTNEQWFLQYAGNGAFYIRSRFSAKYLQVAGGAKTTGANVEMGDFSGADNQKWLILPIGVKPDKTAPATPTNLTVTANNASVRLTWDAVTDEDLLGYTILRSEDGENFYTIMKGVQGTEFTDCEAADDVPYTYVVKAEDNCHHLSERSAAVQASVTKEPGLVMQLGMDENTFDSTNNGNHAFASNPAFSSVAKHKALSLGGGSSSYYADGDWMQLPYTVLNHEAITLSLWTQWRGNNNEVLFCFGNDKDNCLYLIPSNGVNMLFVLKHDGKTERLTTTSMGKNVWNHIAVTIDESGATLYVNGSAVGTNTEMNAGNFGFRPTLNYLGRAFHTKLTYKGYIDDVAVYNYALSAEEISTLQTDIEDVRLDERETKAATYHVTGRRTNDRERGIVVSKDKKILRWN